MKKQELENLLYIALRFKPEHYGIKTNAEGWANIDDLIYRINFLHGQDLLDRISLYGLIKNNPKFTLNVFKTKIKANYVEGIVGETMKKTIPPDVLYYVSEDYLKIHNRFVLMPEEGQKYVILKTEYPYGTPRSHILVIDTRQMSAAGYKFYLASNGDYLTERVSVKFIRSMGG